MCISGREVPVDGLLVWCLNSHFAIFPLGIQHFFFLKENTFAGRNLTDIIFSVCVLENKKRRMQWCT